VGTLVVSCGQASGVFEFSEEAFDQVAIAVEEWAEGEALSAVSLGGDVGEASLCRDLRANGVAVIGLVGEEGAAFRHGAEQRIGLSAIARLPFGQVQLDRQTPSINQSVDLARQAAAGTSHAAIWVPLFRVAPCWWTRMEELSIITNSPSKAWETAVSSRSHTPALRQRTKRL